MPAHVTIRPAVASSKKASRICPCLAGDVVAGFPSPSAQYQEEPLDLNELLVQRPAATFFLRTVGESMIGAGIWPGDILVVDRSLTVKENDVVIACLDNELTVKFFHRERDGKVWLLPSNPSYPPISCGTEQEMEFFGVVTAVIHQFVRR